MELPHRRLTLHSPLSMDGAARALAERLVAGAAPWPRKTWERWEGQVEGARFEFSRATPRRRGFKVRVSGNIDENGHGSTIEVRLFPELLMLAFAVLCPLIWLVPAVLHALGVRQAQNGTPMTMGSALFISAFTWLMLAGFYWYECTQAETLLREALKAPAPAPTRRE